MLSKQTFAAFCLGAITAVAALFLLSAQYSDYRRTAEIKQEIQRLAPLQTQLAAKLADGGIKSSLPTVQAGAGREPRRLDSAAHAALRAGSGADSAGGGQQYPLDGALQRYGQGNQRQGLVFLSGDFQVAFGWVGQVAACRLRLPENAWLPCSPSP